MNSCAWTQPGDALEVCQPVTVKVKREFSIPPHPSLSPPSANQQWAMQGRKAKIISKISGGRVVSLSSAGAVSSWRKRFVFCNYLSKSSHAETKFVCWLVDFIIVGRTAKPSVNLFFTHLWTYFQKKKIIKNFQIYYGCRGCERSVSRSEGPKAGPKG